ncbi:MAG: NAD-dependent protein deacetylase [Pyrodictiaceae archaeon]
MTLEDTLEKAARALASAKNAIALTGAGISAESGIPTFRGKNGLWSKYRPEDLATPEAFERNPKLVWEWYKWRIGIVLSAKPNPGHYALVKLEELGVLKCIITQNVDGLHKKAGQQCLVEMHGNILRARCTRCGHVVFWSKPPSEVPPRCPRCGGVLRPDVVWFGEPIPQHVLERAFRLAEEADLIIVVGTSGVVMPAAALPYIVKRNGGIVIEVNIEPSTLTVIADYFLQGPAGKVLPALAERVERLITKKRTG